MSELKIQPLGTRVVIEALEQQKKNRKPGWSLLLEIQRMSN